MRRMFYLYVLVGAVVISLWLGLLLVDAHFGIDFYPLYFAANRIRAGLSPYGADATAQLVREWPATFAAAGVAYPLPLLLLIVPFTLLPLALAAGVWASLGGISSLAALRLSSSWRSMILLPFLFLPFHRSVVLGQATLIWFGLAALLVSAIHARQPWVVGTASALLLLKPQNGLFFALAGLVWALGLQPRIRKGTRRHAKVSTIFTYPFDYAQDRLRVTSRIETSTAEYSTGVLAARRHTLWWFFGVSLSLGALAFLLQPGWLSAWLAQLELYQSIVHPPSLLPFGLLLLVACWRLPWWARVAAAQVVFFPLSDLYSALPLLFCWIAIGGPLALVGAGISWLWSIGGLPNTVDVFWWLLIWPLILSAVWRTWIHPRLRPTTASAIAAITQTPSNSPTQPAPLNSEPDPRHLES